MTITTLWELVKSSGGSNVTIKGVILDIRGTSDTTTLIVDDGTAACRVIVATQNLLETVFGKDVNTSLQDSSNLKDVVIQKCIAKLIKVSGDVIFDDTGLILTPTKIEFPYGAFAFCMRDIIIKTPIEKEASLVMALRDILGIDAGTDAYYEDPDNFVSVIVRIPTIVQLQAIASGCDAEVLDKPPCFGNVKAFAFERDDRRCGDCGFHNRCEIKCNNQL